MTQYEQYFEQIHANPWLFSVLVAVLFPFAVIVVGLAIHYFGEALALLFSLFVDPWLVYGIINYLFFPGVMLHELAHALLALFTGAKVTEVALFKKQGQALGHVNFRNRGNLFLIALQNIFISSAPMFVGAAIVFGCKYVVFDLAIAPLWLKIAMGYLGTAMFFHMTMSPQDIKVYIRGVPLFIGMLFVVVLPLRLLEVI